MAAVTGDGVEIQVGMTLFGLFDGEVREFVAAGAADGKVDFTAPIASYTGYRAKSTYTTKEAAEAAYKADGLL